MKFPDPTRSPYYIVSPSFTRMSAGIKCLHLLCHMLNRSGERAFFLPHPPELGAGIHPDLITPLLTQTLVDLHFSHGARPIIIYPEVISGNPLAAETVVRYVLNFPGLLGGDASFPPDDIIFGYSKTLADSCGGDAHVLHIPHVDTTLFNADGTGARAGTCYTALKYKYVHGGEVFGLPDGCVEITRDRPDSQSAEEIAALFRRSELFYCFENTSLALEAILCGCPTVMMPNPFFQTLLSQNEIGRNGTAWGTSAEELEFARSTVHLAARNYQKMEDEFPAALAHFIEVTQAATSGQVYGRKVVRPILPSEKGGAADRVMASEARRLALHPIRAAVRYLLNLPCTLVSRSRDERTVSASPLLDRKWYLKEYPDVRKANIDPARHFVESGASEGRDPGPFFSTTDYYAEHKGLREARKNPLVHYLDGCRRHINDAS